MRKLLHKFWADESGAVFVYVLISMAIMVGIASMSVNTVSMHLLLNRLQVTADMSALAGAGKLPDQTAAKAEVNIYAELNMSASNWLDVVGDTDIEFGNWKKTANPKYSTLRTPVNAVRVVARRSSTNAANSNPQATFLPILGAPETVDLTVQAIAWSTVASCYSNGYVTEDKIESGNENNYVGFCLHGQDGVKIDSQNKFDPDAQVSMENLDDLDEGSDNNGLADAISEADNPALAAQQINSLLQDFENLTGPYPDYIDPPSVINISGDYNGPYNTGKYYIVQGVAEIKTNISSVGIYSTKDIKVESNLKLQDVFMAAEEKIEMGSNIQLGAIPYGSDHTPPDPDACGSITGTVFMAAKDLIKLGSNTSMSGVQAISGDKYEIGSENKIHGAVAVQAMGEIKFGSEEQLQGCENDNEHILIPAGGKTLRLVY